MVSEGCDGVDEDRRDPDRLGGDYKIRSKGFSSTNQLVAHVLDNCI